MSNPNDFVIENGVLLKYTGKEDDVIIPSGVCEIGASAFEGCNKIKSVIVPEGVKVIGDHAFNKCTQLQSVSLPTSLEFVCNAAFNVCRELRNLQFPKNTRFEMMDNVTSDCWYLDCLIFPESAQYDARYEVEPFQLYGCNHIACLVCPDFPIEEIVSKQRVAAIQGYIRFTDHY